MLPPLVHRIPPGFLFLFAAHLDPLSKFRAFSLSSSPLLDLVMGHFVSSEWSLIRSFSPATCVQHIASLFSIFLFFLGLLGGFLQLARCEFFSTCVPVIASVGDSNRNLLLPYYRSRRPPQKTSTIRPQKANFALSSPLIRCLVFPHMVRGFFSPYK